MIFAGSRGQAGGMANEQLLLLKRPRYSPQPYCIIIVHF